MSESIEINVVKTCDCSPEQYDVMLGAQQVGYIRLRYGYLCVTCPDVDGETVYEHQFDDGMKGCFDDEDERHKYIPECLVAVSKWMIDNGIIGIAEETKH